MRRQRLIIHKRPIGAAEIGERPLTAGIAQSRMAPTDAARAPIERREVNVGKDIVRRVLAPDQQLGAVGRQRDGSPITQRQGKRRNRDRSGHGEQFDFEAREFAARALKERIDRRQVLFEFADFPLFALNLLDLRQGALGVCQGLLGNLQFRLFARQVCARFASPSSVMVRSDSGWLWRTCSLALI